MVRLALVGCGGFGESHMKALAEAGDDVAIAACVDLDIDRARKAANYLKCDRVATDCLDILDHVDAAVVAVPHNSHHTVGIQLLNAGKHVLMEKPLALTEGQCLDLIHAEQTSGCTLMVAYVMRYHPLLVEMERLIKPRTFGDCFQLSIWTEQHTEHCPHHWTNHIDTLGGGQLFSHGCHYIDILLAWMGEPVEGTHIGSRLGTPWMEVAPGGWVCRVGGISPQHNAFGLCAWVCHRHGREKSLGIRMLGGSEEFVGCCCFDYLADVHYYDTVAYVPDDAEVVGYEDVGEP